MLIVNDEQHFRAGVLSLEDRCKYCSKAFTAYPLILSDDVDQTVYHAACAIELATKIMVDLYTFFSPPPPYDQLVTLTASGAVPYEEVPMQSKEIEEIKAALWERAYHQCSSVSCPMGQVMAKSCKGKVQSG